MFFSREELYSNVCAVCVLSSSVVSNSLRPHGLQQTRLLCPWDSPGKNTGMGSHLLLQGIFLTQESNPHLLCLLHWQADYLPLCPISILLFFIITEPEFLLGPQSTQLNTITSTGFLNVRGDQVTQYWPRA